MQTRSGTIIAAGVIVSFLGIIAVLVYGHGVEKRTKAGPSVTAYTASKEIPAGTKGEDAAGMIAKVAVPRSVVPSGAISSPAQLGGRTFVRAVAKGEVVTTAALGQGDVAPAGGLQVPPGYNAVSLELSVPQAVAEYVQAGDVVNVYATFKGDGGKAETKLVLANVQVLANQTASRSVARGLGSSPAGGDTILTVALQPQDAEKALFAAQSGSVWFGLVHPGDAPARTNGVDATSVLR
jgi:pilus assembly protein CpaB